MEDNNNNNNNSRKEENHIPSNFLFRVLRVDEKWEEGLFAKDTKSEDTITDHVLRGSQPGYKSPFISTTDDLYVAIRFAGAFQNIVEIEQKNLNVFRLTTEANQHLKTKLSTNNKWDGQTARKKF